MSNERENNELTLENSNLKAKLGHIDRQLKQLRSAVVDFLYIYDENEEDKSVCKNTDHEVDHMRDYL